jgi:hypothetical protein
LDNSHYHFLGNSTGVGLDSFEHQAISLESK